jgi:hypothetical protein
MANILEQHDGRNLFVETPTLARKSVTADQKSATSTERNGVRDSSHSIDRSTNSGELLLRLSNLIDGFVRLSRGRHSLPVDVENPDGWTIFERVSVIQSIAGCHDGAPFSFRPQNESACSVNG